ncbi:MAG: SCP2 sterol-binding domain-containing protein [Chloroflexota bacterium]|nr:SCP2 sterol-binding domain-containing protein [Chloroflexota bacterium]
MSYPFISEEWIRDFAQAINESEAYKEHAATWDYGAVALVINADPQLGFEEDCLVWLDLHMGQCREARVLPKAEAGQAPFVIYGDYNQWKGLIKGEVELIPALMQGRLRLKGDLGVIIKYIRAAKDLITAARQVPTLFAEE